MIDAHVEGRPMPSSSSRFTRLASVKRAGGLVEWPFGVTAAVGTVSPSCNSGRRVSSSRRSLSSSPSVAASSTARWPVKVMVVPLAANSQSVDSWADVPPRRTLTVTPRASAICEAKVRCHTSVYSARSCRFSSDATASGGRNGVVGRIASWASWAFFDDDVYCLGADER